MISEQHTFYNFINRKISFALFWIVLSFIYSAVFVTVEFAGFPASGFKAYLDYAFQWCVVSCAASMLIGLLSVSRLIFSIFFPVLLILSSTAAYFRITMGLAITPALIEVTLINDFSTWAQVISLPLVLLLILQLVIAGAIVWYRWKRVSNPPLPLVWLGVFAFGVLSPVYLIKRIQFPVCTRIPYSFIYSTREWYSNRSKATSQRDTYLTTSAIPASDSPDVILVIGESLRADHLQLNGYHRATTPNLAADSSVISLPNVITRYFVTHISVPHILTRENPDNDNAAFSEQSFITLFKKAGYRTAWISNQDQVPTYAYFMHEGDTLIQCNTARDLYFHGKWTDDIMIQPFEEWLRRDNRKSLTILHTIGSHWWYPSHYPDSLAKFKPEVNSRIFSELSSEQLNNSYDNTILATDLFLSSLISRLKNRNAILIFISDHGEGLGEDGVYMHPYDHPSTRNVACLVWTSDIYKQSHGDKVSNLKGNRNNDYTTSAIFHSVLDGAGISTAVCDTTMSFFSK